jgi:type IV pilus assembly protein PilB
VRAALQRPIVWKASDPATIRTLIDRSYRADADIDRLVQAFDQHQVQHRGLEQTSEIDLDDQAPVVQLVNRVVGQALRDRASDIHIEPLDDRVRIRFRIDGHLVETFTMPMGVHAPLTSRLKIMSGMNIVEKRRPQDGQFSTVVDGRDVDVRVGSVSTVFGEKIVMRILDKQRSMIGLDQLGFPRETYLHYSKLIHSPFGMVICAGPTGAGKTTTLYATLAEINSLGKNVTTIEDPVEYIVPGINQIQTNDQAGLTFATGLKAILRQDPDVILVGEMRDVDTARIAVQSALTGHFVLSSLHGTDSVSALHRLLDMGIEAFLVASSVVGVIGQRLLRVGIRPHQPSAGLRTDHLSRSGSRPGQGTEHLLGGVEFTVGNRINRNRALHGSLSRSVGAVYQIPLRAMGLIWSRHGRVDAPKAC